MRNKLLTFGILAVVFSGFLAPQIIAAQTTSGPQPTTSSDLWSSLFKSASNTIIEPIANWIAAFLMMLSGLVLTLVGYFFDWIVKLSIIDMAKNIGNSEGLGGSITAAWATLRDIANMFFIFVLLFAAFRAMFSLNFGNVGKTIGNIILIALLINFSLFFSKVVIDASNVVAVGFYNAIVNSNTASQTAGESSTTGAGSGQRTVSEGYMRLLKLQTWHDSNILTITNGLSADKILLVGILSSIFFLITAVILLISGVMFLARFIILIFLMILSPLAFIAFIVPGMKGKFDEWWHALVDQSFFAPVFFAMTWVVFRIASNSQKLMGVPDTSNDTYIQSVLVNPGSFFAIILNYTIILGFAVAALIFAKKMATSGATAFAFKGITGAIGAVGVGGAAFAGRQTVGRAASRLEKSQRFQRLAASNPKTIGALYSGTKKAARGSFDVRQSDILKKTPVLGKELDVLGTSTRGQGGFEKYREDKTKKVVDGGKQFTDRQARVEYAKRVASKIGTYRGSVPNNIPSLFGTMGRSNRMAAATLFDERIKELRTEIGTARGEINTYRNTMGIASTPGVAPTAAQLALLSPYEQGRYNLLTDPSITRNGSVANLNSELTNLQTDRTTYGLDNTLKQQF